MSVAPGLGFGDTERIGVAFWRLARLDVAGWAGVKNAPVWCGRGKCAMSQATNEEMRSMDEITKEDDRLSSPAETQAEVESYHTLPTLFKYRAAGRVVSR